MAVQIASGFVTIDPPSDLMVVSSTDSSIEIGWTGVSDADSYVVYRDGAFVGSPLYCVLCCGRDDFLFPFPSKAVSLLSVVATTLRPFALETSRLRQGCGAHL